MPNINDKIDEILNLLNLTNDANTKEKLKQILPDINENELSNLMNTINYFGDFKDGYFSIIKPDFETDIPINSIEKAAMNILLSVIQMQITILSQQQSNQNDNISYDKYKSVNYKNIKELILFLLEYSKNNNNNNANTNDNDNNKQNIDFILFLLNSIYNDLIKDILYNNNPITGNSTIHMYSSMYYILQFAYYMFISSMSNNKMAEEIKELNMMINNNQEIPANKIQMIPILTISLLNSRYKQKAISTNNVKKLTMKELIDKLKTIIGNLNNEQK